LSSTHPTPELTAALATLAMVVPQVLHNRSGEERKLNHIQQVLGLLNAVTVAAGDRKFHTKARSRLFRNGCLQSLIVIVLPG